MTGQTEMLMKRIFVLFCITVITICSLVLIYRPSKKRDVERILGITLPSDAMDVELSYIKYPDYNVLRGAGCFKCSFKSWMSLEQKFRFVTSDCAPLARDINEPWWQVPESDLQKNRACFVSQDQSLHLLWISNVVFFEFRGSPPLIDLERK